MATWNGIIEYAVSLKGDKPGGSGSGRLARIIFHGKGEGKRAVAFTRSLLSDPASVPIEHTTKDGLVEVPEPQGIVSGRVLLERRASNAGTDVCLNGTCAVTPEDGSYTFYGVTPGPHNLTVRHMSYLRS